MDKRYFVIVNEAIGAAAGDIGIHFQLAPGEDILIDEKLTASSGFEEGWNVLVKPNKQKGLKLIEEEGQVSFEYTKKIPRSAFGYHIIKTKQQEGIRFVTLVAPYENEKPKVKIKIVGKPKIGSSGMQLILTENGKHKAFTTIYL